VFVTAFHEHALRAFGVAAVDYLLKPFDDVRFGAAWARLVERTTLHAIRDESRRLAALLHALGGQGGVGAAATLTVPAPHGGEPYAERIVVKRDQRTSVVPVSAVQWVESSGNYVVLHAGRERHELRETLTSLESRLDPARFVRIHRRVLVAIESVRELQPWFGGDQVLLLKDGTKLRVSRSYREQFAQRLAGR
jgi:two-component system, LytTR family, response regulator